MLSDAELLKAYLADRDERCPGCGYSLKGCASTRCPECGSGIEITLRGDTTFAAHWITGTIAISGALGLALPTLCGSIMQALFNPEEAPFPHPVLCAPMTAGIAALLWVWAGKRMWTLRLPASSAWSVTIALWVLAWLLALTPYFAPR